MLVKVEIKKETLITLTKVLFKQNWTPILTELYQLQLYTQCQHLTFLMRIYFTRFSKKEHNLLVLITHLQQVRGLSKSMLHGLGQEDQVFMSKRQTFLNSKITNENVSKSWVLAWERIRNTYLLYLYNILVVKSLHWVDCRTQIPHPNECLIIGHQYCRDIFFKFISY